MKGKILTVLLISIGFSQAAIAAERYQAHWNGNEYLILDSSQGHMWTYKKGNLVYNGQLDGDEFEPPARPQIWNQFRGKWTQQGQ